MPRPKACKNIWISLSFTYTQVKDIWQYKTNEHRDARIYSSTHFRLHSRRWCLHPHTPTLAPPPHTTGIGIRSPSPRAGYAASKRVSYPREQMAMTLVNDVDDASSSGRKKDKAGERQRMRRIRQWSQRFFKINILPQYMQQKTWIEMHMLYIRIWLSKYIKDWVWKW